MLITGRLRGKRRRPNRIQWRVRSQISEAKQLFIATKFAVQSPEFAATGLQLAARFHQPADTKFPENRFQL